MRFRHAVPILFATALAAACSDSPPAAGPATPAPGTGPTATRPGEGGDTAGGPGGFVRLAAFADCDAFLDHVREQAAERVGPYGLGGAPMPVDTAWSDMVLSTEAPAATMPADMSFDAGVPGMAAGDSSNGDDSSDGVFTSTNVQEAGIDEADLVKTDGERIVAIANGTLYVVDPTLPDARVTGSIDLADEIGDVGEMMLAGERVLLFGNRWDPETNQPATTVTEVTLASAEPELLASVEFDGSYLSARLIGNRLRVALSSAPGEIPFVVPGSPAGEELAEETNQRAVLATELADWTPEFELTVGGDVVAEGPLTDCANLHRPSVFSGFDVLTVLDIDTAAAADASALAAAFDGTGAPAGTVGVLGAGSTVYSSQARMYVATTRWVDPRDRFTDADATTAIHAFAIDPVEPTRYVASGEVPGTLLSQFSLDEHDGNLRVVVTDTDANGTTESRLVVLAEQADQLTEIGSVGGLGRGERLYSVRLVGDIGFAVTFRQVDPFYVIDLRDPTAPRIAGELKIPGMSTYLHPIGDVSDSGLVVGVGQDATDDGMTTGLKLSVFDVSDPANPQEVAKWVRPGAASVAEYDHRAFQIVGDTVILPVAFPSPSAYLLRIGQDGTITELGEIEHILDGFDGHSDCRVLDADDFPTEDSTFYWDIRNGARLQVCGPNDTGGWDGSLDNCSAWALDEFATGFWSTEAYDAAVTRIAAGPADRIEQCYPSSYFPPIQRSMAIDGTVWTFSPIRLQANALDDLALQAVVALP